jgi:hypothetical protein
MPYLRSRLLELCAENVTWARRPNAESIDRLVARDLNYTEVH